MVKTTLNPMETYRREQKKKEVKKHRAERQKEKKEKLQSMDRVALEEQLKLLERQMAVKTSTDGPSRKRKQELEDTLRAVVKRQKEMEEEEERRKKLTDASLPSPMSLTELMQRNREKFENPEDSIYYHPTLNPFGAPPPGKPQLYRQGQQPSGPMGLPRSPCHGQPSQHRHLERPSQHRFQHRLLLPRIERRIQEPPFATMQQPRGMVKRPGKRPPLPLDPPATRDDSGALSTAVTEWSDSGASASSATCSRATYCNDVAAGFIVDTTDASGGVVTFEPHGNSCSCRWQSSRSSCHGRRQQRSCSLFNN
uniref:Wbp11/ELF5/Saf1 N-terminal domain-containing protein n=1 Tax=Peronospora matthiolae TaxID=2874970 RepID=A0AAV1U469_9STRA